jgi:hypothetical protein
VAGVTKICTRVRLAGGFPVEVADVSYVEDGHEFGRDGDYAHIECSASMPIRWEHQLRPDGPVPSPVCTS